MVRAAVAALAASGLASPAALGAQTAPDLSRGFPDPAGAATPGLTGPTLFMVPSAETLLGSLRLGATLELEWGDVDGVGARAVATLPIAPSATATLAWRETSATAGQHAYGDRALSLALAGSRGGLAGEYRTADAAVGAFARADLGLDVGVTLRTTEAVRTTEATWDRIFMVGGYEFISRRSISRLDAVRYQDIELRLSAPLGPVRVTGFGGQGLARNQVRDRRWAFLRVTAPIQNRLELVAEAGRDGGLPAIARGPGDFVRLGLRMRLWGSETDDTAPGVVPDHDGDADAPALARVHGGLRPSLRVRAPTARSVDVRGSFTGWEPRSMTPTGDGIWIFPVPHGVIRFDLRLDGADWSVPAGVPVIPDEFTGAPVAVVVVTG
jgi:hypothetical protein